MNRKSKKYDIAFENAVNLLEDNFDLIYIFPDYFLERLEKNNIKIYKVFTNKNFKNILKKKKFAEKVDLELEKYKEDILNMRKKSDLICEWEQFLDNTTFFPYLMGFQVLKFRDKVKKIDYSEMQKIDFLVKDKNLTSKQAMEKFGLKEKYLKDYLESQELNYTK